MAEWRHCPCWDGAVGTNNETDDSRVDNDYDKGNSCTNDGSSIDMVNVLCVPDT